MKGFVLALSCSLVFSSCVNAKTISDSEFFELSQKCAPNVSADTLKALVRTESSYNPFAIAVVGGSVRQPNNLLSALNTVKELEEKGMNYSLGLGQINKKNSRILKLLRKSFLTVIREQIKANRKASALQMLFLVITQVMKLQATGTVMFRL